MDSQVASVPVPATSASSPAPARTPPAPSPPPPLRGTSHGNPVWYVVTDDSNQADALARGVNYAPKLANAVGTPSVQTVTLNAGLVDFPATVSFGRRRQVTPGPTAFPPAIANPGAVGDPTYSPLIKLPDGTVLNAPQIANATGAADKVVRIDTRNMAVQYLETEGFYEGKFVHYASFDSGSPVAAAIEDMTYAPALNVLPAAHDEALNTSARERLVAFINGPTGPTNPSRQGVNASILDGMDPHNILHETPVLPDHPSVGDLTYAPMWDVHFAAWTPAAINDGDRQQVRSVDDVASRVTSGLITGPGGGPFQAAGFVVNCPLISIDLP